MVMLTKST